MAPIRMNNDVLAQAEEYQKASSRVQAISIQKKNGVRYSELLGLPCFDIVRMMITDPMHTILLGITMKLSWPYQFQLSEFYSRIKAVKIPYDLGRLPTNLNGDSLAGLTAQQWKNFACTYARLCLAGLLEGRAYKSLCLLCENVELIVKSLITRDEIASLYRLLNEHHKQFAKVYGKWEVKINYHMA